MKRGAVIGCLTWHRGGRRNRHMKAVGRYGGQAVGLMVASTIALTAIPPYRLTAQVLSPRDSAVHALNRLAYGPRPGDVDRVAQGSVMTWIEQQLAPERIDDAHLAERERRFDLLSYSRDDLARLYLDAQRARRERQQAQRADSMMGPPADQADQSPERLRARRLAGELQELAVVRAALSERQLQEVMVDFWTNHFNVFLGKGADRFLMPSYIEETIRPRALGKFSDLLIATARSPAMLFYLDNWESVAPGSQPPHQTRNGELGTRNTLFRLPRSAFRVVSANRMPKGINENYARELLELHTLGVDGGYTQQDVIAVARIFTGWSIAPPPRGGGFEFHDWAHDRGAKTVLRVAFPPGHGEDEAVRLLALLANSPATMHHVSRQLCARFVADHPPDGYAERQEDWLNSGALLARMNAAVAIAAGRLPGASVDLDALVPATADRDSLIAAVNDRLLAGTMSEHTKTVIRDQLSDVGDPRQARALAIGLALGGPDFQRQ